VAYRSSAGPKARASPGASKWLRGVPIALDRPEEAARAINAAIDALALRPDERAAMADYAARSYSWEKIASGIVKAIEASRRRE
jgi:alpha-maltose-1-phosphate synthase